MPIFFRDDASWEVITEQEMAANPFAPELLTPAQVLVEQVRDEPIDPHDESSVRRSGAQLGVSTQALTIRPAGCDGHPTYIRQ